MISSHDRSYYIGASDTDYIVGNWETKTFQKWWAVKLGLTSDRYTNIYMATGTAYEHRILDSLGFPIQKDKQIISGRLRVNLDGNTESTIYEVKTYKKDNGFKVSRKYWRQVQVEMFGSGLRRAFIVAYALEDDDYMNWYREIDQKRITFHEVKYDVDFITNEYAPKLDYVSFCLDRGVFPTKGEFEKCITVLH